MKKKKFGPFEKLVLDKREQEIEDSLEEYAPADDSVINKMFEEAAKNFPELEQTKSVTVRIKKKDLVKLKARAARSNVPYQTLINILINSYTSGKTKLTL